MTFHCLTSCGTQQIQPHFYLVSHLRWVNIYLLSKYVSITWERVLEKHSLPISWISVVYLHTYFICLTNHILSSHPIEMSKHLCFIKICYYNNLNRLCRIGTFSLNNMSYCSIFRAINLGGYIPVVLAFKGPEKNDTSHFHQIFKYGPCIVYRNQCSVLTQIFYLSYFLWIGNQHQPHFIKSSTWDEPTFWFPIQMFL